MTLRSRSVARRSLLLHFLHVVCVCVCLAESKTGEPYLTSPRSLEACLRIGVEPADLLRKPFAFFKTLDGERLSDKHAQEREQRYETRRQGTARPRRGGGVVVAVW
jgi:hypothetical protein